jgi:MinD superfamily P-loop ATPase
MIGANEILVQQLLCLNQRICSHKCAKCQAICPQNAIEMNQKTGIVTLNGDCTNCGLCIIECPAQAIGWQNIMRYPLKINDGEIEIFCTEIKCDGYAPCLANLNEYELAYLAVKAEVVLCLDQTVCVECRPNIVKHLYKMVERVSCFLANLDIKPITFSGQQKKIAEQINRRELFSFVFTKIKQSISEVLPAVQNPSDYRSLLVTELQQRFTEVKGMAAPLFKGAKGFDNCTMCGTCVRACRNKALQIVMDQEKNRSELLHNQTLCTGCNVCSIVCPEKAIEISVENSSLESIARNKPTLVIAKPLTICETCGKAIIEEVQMVCQDCRRKQDKKLQDIY